MLQKLRQQTKDQDGFTIIEVLIVLAIAGLIMLIVFLAVPALQRNARNTAIKSDASHLATAVNDFISNNGGTLPVPANATTIFDDAGGQRGLSQLGTLNVDTTDSTITGGSFVIDPTTSSWSSPAVTRDTVVVLEDTQTTSATSTTTATTSGPNGWVCNGATPTYTGTPRNVVLMYSLEGGSSTWTWSCLTVE